MTMLDWPGKCREQAARDDDVRRGGSEEVINLLARVV